MAAAVLVVNFDGAPLHRVSVNHAIRMICRQVAEIAESEPDIQYGPFPLPTVVRLVRYVVTKWRYTQGPRWSRSGVLVRDHHRCAYCGGAGTTVDHIFPSSRGGKDTWENTVTACAGCNQRKADRTPVEAGMRARFEPWAPKWASLSAA